MRRTEKKYFGKTRLERRAGFLMLSLNLFFFGLIAYKGNIDFMRLV